ncbi:MAG TPA: glycosyltransferase family 4 protein [Blastocatellia bacterium]|nr:glycosyltransferase family 4 protein [Blastocatellia bacterium]
MNNSLKPNLLILTSSFPQDPRDETCGYVRDFARKLSTDFNVEVLTLDDEQASEWPEDQFKLIRSKSFLPLRLNRAQASNDLNGLLAGSWLVKLAAILALLSYFQKAFRLARRANVVCSHWMVPCGLAGAIISKFMGKPHVAVEHSGAIHLLARTRGGSTVARFITRHSHRVITVSQDLKTKLLALCPDAAEKVEVIPMGVDPSRRVSAYRASAGKKRLLFVGRLTPIKGLDLLLEALRGQNDIELVVAGDGEQRRELESLARTHSIDAKFVGRVSASERDDLFSASDIVVIPSLALADGRTEGMPVICLEAMAAGRPIVASRVGGLPEIIVDGENGLLFDPGNVAMLANKLRMLVDDSALRESISRKALETVSIYGWETVAPRFVCVIKDSMRSDEPVIHNQRYKTGNANG